MLHATTVGIDKVNDLVGKAIAWLTLLMVVQTFVIVVLRYQFNMGWIALQESVIYMHAVVFLLGTASTLKQDAHVRVDIFYREMSAQRKALVDIIGGLIFLLPVCSFILYSSWGYVLDSWEVKEASGEAGGLPWVYLLKTTLPVMAILLLLQGIAEILRNTLFLLQANNTGSE